MAASWLHLIAILVVDAVADGNKALQLLG